MRRYPYVVLTSAFIMAATIPLAWSQQAFPTSRGAPGEVQLNADTSCPSFLRAQRAGRIAERTADRFEKQRPQWDSSSALDFLRNQLSSGLQVDLTSSADAALIRNMLAPTVSACFPRLGAVIASLTQGSEYERFGAAQRERRERRAQEQEAGRDAAQDAYSEFHQRNREHAQAETKERAALSSLGTSGADTVRRTQELQAESQRKFDAALVEAAKPMNMLLTAYRNYLVVRQCFESRVGFAVVYLTQQQADEAKVQVKGIETALVQREPNLNSDERWATANSLETAANQSFDELIYTGRGHVKERAFTDGGQRFCRAAVGWLRETYGGFHPDSRNVRKDF